jgi:hypothetical protein
MQVKAQVEGPPNRNVETFMRAKLIHSQKVLEGLTTENFDLIAKESQQMSLLSLASTWQVIETPEYTRRSNEFRRAADDLTKAAKNKNLDGATLAFVNVTLKCVECHKYVRTVRQAELDLPQWRSFKPLVARQSSR